VFFVENCPFFTAFCREFVLSSPAPCYRAREWLSEVNNSAAGGQHEHHTIMQARSAGVIKTGANRSQHIEGDFLRLCFLLFRGIVFFVEHVMQQQAEKHLREMIHERRGTVFSINIWLVGSAF